MFFILDILHNIWYNIGTVPTAVLFYEKNVGVRFYSIETTFRHQRLTSLSISLVESPSMIWSPPPYMMYGGEDS